MLIGELARATGVTAKTLRYYEQAGLLHEPHRAANGYRNYSADVVPRVAFIRHAQTAGLALQQIRAVLDIGDNGHPRVCTSPRSSSTVSPTSNGVYGNHAKPELGYASSNGGWPSSTPPTASPPASAQPSHPQAHSGL